MNCKLLKTFLLLFTLLLIVNLLTAQTPETVFEAERPDSDLLIAFYAMVLTALTNLWGIIAKAVGLKKMINRFVLVVLAGGLTLAGIFIHWGLLDSLPAVLSVLGSMGIFDLFKAGTTDKPEITQIQERLQKLELKMPSA